MCLPWDGVARIFQCAAMMKISWAAELLAAVALILGLIYIGGRWRSHRSTGRLGYLGTVSEHWLAVHRTEH